MDDSCPTLMIAKKLSRFARSSSHVASIEGRVTSISFLSETPRMLRDLVLIRWNAMRGVYGP